MPSYTILTHHDMDGVTCYILLANLFGDQIKHVYSCGYEHIETKIGEIEKEVQEEDRKLLITDLSLKKHQYDRLYNHFHGRVYTFDHHESTKIEFGNLQNVKVDTSVSASKLIFNSVTWVSNRVEALKTLVELVDTYDMWKIDEEAFKHAYLLNELWHSYGWNGFVSRFGQGYVEITDAEKETVIREVKDRRKLIEDSLVKKYDSDGVIFFFFPEANRFINDLLVQNKQYKVYFFVSLETWKVSVRLRGEGMKSLADVFESVFNGDGTIENYGGHPYAGGYVYKVKPTMDLFEKHVDAILEFYQ